MDYNNLNFDVYHILNVLNENSMYIFVLLIFGFGTLMYYLSIKTANPVFDSPKLSKKKPKKEKQIRSKNVKTVSQKVIQTKETEIIDLKKTPDVIETGKEPTDDEGASNWLPVVKSKKTPKPVKAPVNIAPVPIIDSQKKKKFENVTVQTVSSPTTIDNNNDIIIKEKPKPSTKYESKSTVIEHICDTTDFIESLETVQIIPKQQQQPVKECTLSFVEDEEKKVIDEELRNVSESPTNSLSDDFEIIDVYKTSSEDCLKLEHETNIEDIDLTSGISSAISSTSGASRKKNKKQQKMISKQLIEAAAAEEEEIVGGGGRGGGEDGQKKPIIEIKPKPIGPSSISVGKKKRPRKEY